MTELITVKLCQLLRQLVNPLNRSQKIKIQKFLAARSYVYVHLITAPNYRQLLLFEFKSLWSHFSTHTPLTDKWIRSTSTTTSFFIYFPSTSNLPITHTQKNWDMSIFYIILFLTQNLNGFMSSFRFSDSGNIPASLLL